MQIKIENLSYIYSEKTPFERHALRSVSCEIFDGECVGIIGATGSGKSTLIQHLNGLIKLKSGKITVFDIDLTAKKPDLKLLRKGIGMLFQYPEYQLFADTVLADVMFGPLNFGFSRDDAKKCAEDALRLVGLSDDLFERSPLELSGGQKRRAAIAGVLSYAPKILILDEPTAGLDPVGKREILDLVTRLRAEKTVETVIMVSHNMDEIAAYADRVIVLSDGKLIHDTAPSGFFYNGNPEELSLEVPHTVNISRLLEREGVYLPKNILNPSALTDALIEVLTRKGANDA